MIYNQEGHIEVYRILDSFQDTVQQNPLMKYCTELIYREGNGAVYIIRIWGRVKLYLFYTTSNGVNHLQDEDKTT